MKKMCLLIVVLLCITPSIFAQSVMTPSLRWQKSLGGTKLDQAFTIINTLDQGFLVIGESFSDDGDVTGHHGSTDSSDAWVVKLDKDGTIQWQKSFGGSRNDRLTDGIAMPDGSFILTGSTESDNGDVSGLHSTIAAGNYVANSDLWILKIDAAGTILWSKLFGGTLTETGLSIQKYPGGGFVVAGTAASSDFDLTANNGFEDIWILKLNDAGIVDWKRNYGDVHRDFTSSLTVMGNGDLLVAGYTRVRPDFVSTPQCQAVYSRYSDNFLRVKGADGSPVWQVGGGVSCGNPGPSSIGFKLMEMPTGNILYLGGFFNSSLENGAKLSQARINTATGAITNKRTESGTFYEVYNEMMPAPRKAHMFADSSVMVAYSHKVSNTEYQVSLTSIDTRLPAGSFTTYYRKLMGGGSFDVANSLAVIDEGNYAIAGSSISNNGDVSGNHGGYDVWIVRLGKVNFIKGTVYYDNNSNGIKDANESFVSNLTVESKKGTGSFSSVTRNPEFMNSVDTGTYTTKIISYLPYHTPVPATKNSTFANYYLTDSFSFALQPIPGKRDYEVSILPQSAARPGFNVSYSVRVLNVGADTLQNKTVRFVKDSRLQFISSIPAATSQLNDTITWTVNNIAPRDAAIINLTLKIAAPPAVNAGDSIVNRASIDTTADLNIVNNYSISRQIVTNSFDPNDKMESGGGTMYKVDYDAGNKLYYTIRFQNTGNDTAFTVVIRDTLSTRLDTSTLEMIGSSHPYQLQIKNGRYCTWTFSNIMLPDSNVNEPLSHGYINFRIKPKTGFAMGDTLENTASIYFDFNSPIRTNTHQTVIRIPVPPMPVVTGLVATYCNTGGTEKGKIMNLPASNSGITVDVRLDGGPLTVDADSTFSFPVYALAAGPHMITIGFVNAAGGKSVTHNFTVSAAITPEVNVSASSTNIITLAVPVVLTATNAAGGGSAPKYTFAKDRTFATILQAEGTSNTLSIDPSTLTIGDNWIYVKMKSNATCIVTDINTDSIKLVRDMSTGITDPDNPGRVISLYPNPFRQHIYIKGLSVSKSYTLILSDISGKRMQQKVVSNSNVADLMINNYRGGIYLLSIYDNKQKRLIGTIKLLGQ